jgi:hypothetical protein
MALLSCSVQSAPIVELLLMVSAALGVLLLAVVVNQAAGLLPHLFTRMSASQV